MDRRHAMVGAGEWQRDSRPRVTRELVHAIVAANPDRAAAVFGDCAYRSVWPVLQIDVVYSVADEVIDAGAIGVADPQALIAGNMNRARGCLRQARRTVEEIGRRKSEPVETHEARVRCEPDISPVVLRER